MRSGIFSIIWLISLEKLIGFSLKFYHIIGRTRKFCQILESQTGRRIHVGGGVCSLSALYYQYLALRFGSCMS